MVGLASPGLKPDHSGMTLATTCPRCKTSFRVVADQLKLRRGMVRCGVCQNVFNGLEHLRYVEALSNPESETNAASSGQARPEPVKVNVPPIRVSSPPVAAGFLEQPTQPLPNKSIPQTFGSAASATGSAAPAPIFPPRSVTPETDALGSLAQGSFAPQNAPDNSQRNNPAQLFDQSKLAPIVPASLAEKATPAKYTPITDADLDDIYPANRHANTEFLNDRGLGESTTLTRSDDDVQTAFFLPESVPAQMQADVIQPPRSIQTDYVGKGQSVATRNSLSIADREEDAVDFFSSEHSNGTTHDRASHWLRRTLVGLLLIAFVVQGLLLARNWLSVRLPSVQPGLEILSSLFGMKVEIPRNLSMLTIESFDVQSTARPDILSVSAIVRNRSAYSVQWPAMELTLTGVDGKPILRKILLPREYLNQAPTERGVPGGSEHPIRIGLQTEPIEAKGFSVNIFYPN